jgi:glycosyltransferase involved in cell wall biosynthesis
LVASLNEGMEIAKGKYIARMDADDISLPERLESQIHLMEIQNLDICGCHYEIINENSKKIDVCLVPLDCNSLMLFLVFSIPFSHGSVLMRHDFLKVHNFKYGRRFKYAEDKALWIEMYQAGARFGNVDSILFKYREFNHSLSKINGKNLSNDVRVMRYEFIKNNIESVKCSIVQLNNQIQSLSYREIEYLSDIIFYIALRFRHLMTFRLLKPIPMRYRVISFFKAIKWLGW